MENSDVIIEEELSLDAADVSLIYEGDELLNEKESEEEEEEDKNGGEAETNEGETKDTKNEKQKPVSQTKPDEPENFGIELRGIPKSMTLSVGLLKRLFNETLQLQSRRVKITDGNIVYVNFHHSDARFKALTLLEGYKWQGGTLRAKEADFPKDSVNNKREVNRDVNRAPKKEHKEETLDDRIRKAVTPYHGMSYKDQLTEKDRILKAILKKYGNELASLNPKLRKFVSWHQTRRKGQICDVDDFVESPVKEGYRNKCEFTIGKNKESEHPVVGFRIASVKEGLVEVGPVAHLSHLNEKMKQVCKLMEKYLESSSYPPFDPFSHKGVWRQLTVRTSNNDDVMIIVLIHPQEMNEEEITGIKDSLQLFFTEGEGAEAGITSIFFQQIGQKESGKDAEYEHIYGKTYIEETILGKTFRASPDAFLQVNTPACEALYKKIAEVAEIDSTSVVLDICCGVGTIGLSVAESSYTCMGIEKVDNAVENAKLNAENNNVTNTVFYNGKVEDYIDNMITLTEKKAIAIIDPPRAGVCGTVISALRKCDHLTKLVYVSCDPQAVLANFRALGRPKSETYKGTFFIPVRAIPVDLFPDTPHFEIVIVFERYDELKWDRMMNGNPKPNEKEFFNKLPKVPKGEQPKEGEKRDGDRRRGGKGRKRERERDIIYRRRESDRLAEVRRLERSIREKERSEQRGVRGGIDWRSEQRGVGGVIDWRSDQRGIGVGSDQRGIGVGIDRRSDLRGIGVGSDRRSDLRGIGVGSDRRSDLRGIGVGSDRRSAPRSIGGGNDFRSAGELGGWQRIDRNDDSRVEGRGVNNGGGGEGLIRRGVDGGLPKDFKHEYGEGFQEGFKAALEALRGQQGQQSQQSDFGQGGGWNKAKPQGEFGAPRVEENFSMKRKENQDLCGWDYTGDTKMNMNTGVSPRTGQVGGSFSSFQALSTQPVAYPKSVTHPQGPGYSGGWNQSGNLGGGNIEAGWGSQRSGTQFQGYDEPSSKKWKGPQQPKPNSGINYDYSNY